MTDRYWQCVCPASDDKPPLKGCDSATEVCSKVKVVDVQAGFKYEDNSQRKWLISSVLMTAFSILVASPSSYSSNSNDMETGYMYNFWATSLTWGI